MILLMANDFIMDVTDGSCQLAEHRGSKTVEMKDLALYLSSFAGKCVMQKRTGTSTSRAIR